MKTMVLTPVSQKSTATRDRSGGDSFYFPECQKTINCHCKMCVASIKATRDLVSSRSTLQQSSITKTSTMAQSSSPPPDPTNPTTPKTRESRRVIASATLRSPPLRSTAKSVPVVEKEVEGERKKGLGFGWSLLMWVLGVLVVLAGDSVVQVVVERVVGGTKMSGEVVRRIGEELEVKGGFKERLGLLEDRLEGVSGRKMSICSSDDSVWAMNKDDNLLHMKCVFYKSMAEEVSIWGFPLQSSGLLVTGLSPRSFTVISGKFSEWPEGKIKFSTIEHGGSWISSRQSASAVQLAGNTWILEYHQSPLLQNSRVVPLAWEFLKMRGSQIAKELMKFDWMLQSSYVLSMSHADKSNAMPPT